MVDRTDGSLLIVIYIWALIWLMVLWGTFLMWWLDNLCWLYFRLVELKHRHACLVFGVSVVKADRYRWFMVRFGAVRSWSHRFWQNWGISRKSFWYNSLSTGHRHLASILWMRLHNIVTLMNYIMNRTGCVFNMLSVRTLDWIVWARARVRVLTCSLLVYLLMKCIKFLDFTVSFRSLVVFESHQW